MEWRALFNKIEKEKKGVNVTPLSYHILSILTQEKCYTQFETPNFKLGPILSSKQGPGFNVNAPHKGKI
jgi:hypothetical protein